MATIDWYSRLGNSILNINSFYKNKLNKSCPNNFNHLSNRRKVVITTDNLTYATGQVILDLNLRNKLTDGQHFAWRCSEWKNIESKLPPNIYRNKWFLENLMDMDPDLQLKCKENIINYYLFSYNLTPLGNERIIAIDSSFLSKIDTNYFMTVIMNNNIDKHGDIIMDTPTNIFVETYIPLLESLFKLNNSERDSYQNIEFNNIHSYIKYSEKRPENEVGIKIRCSKYEVHKALQKREDEFFKCRGMYKYYNGKWAAGIRNMINDHAIIDLLLDTSKKIPTSIPIIATNDQEMISYAIKNNVYYITSPDGVNIYSNYKINGVNYVK